MCGIFGYVGQNTKAHDLVFEGLKTLEYRGYDSWGVAAKSQGDFIIEKHVGKIGNSKLNSDFQNLSSGLSIGHTRWATHGGVTDKNAHPHLDCTGTIAVMHNGIIENYEELKKDLLAKGHKFISETDTETLPHLIEENMKTRGFATSVRDAFNSLKGLNAIVVANAKSSEIIAGKNGSPIIVGKADDALFVSSDASGLLNHTNNLLFLKDNEMVILGKDVKLINLIDGSNLKPRFVKVAWKKEEASKGKFKHFMIKEIYEQSRVLNNIQSSLSAEIENLTKIIKESKGVFLIGSGTAFNACLAGQYFFSKIAKEHINTISASEFNYLEDFLNSKSLVIALSQSGETIDVIEPLKAAKNKGSKIIAIVNALGSTIYRMADFKLLLLAGPEKAVASTKAYVAKLGVLLLLAHSFIGKIEEGKIILEKTAVEIDRILKETKNLKKIAKKLSTSQHIFTVGRGVSYSTALEAALKIKEVSYIHTEGLAGGELKHGAIALITKGTPCIIFAPNDETYSSIISNATEIKARGGHIIGVSFKNASVFDDWIEVKDIKAGSYIAQVVPLQLLAYFLAVIKKLDPDKPRNLAKSVTVK